MPSKESDSEFNARACQLVNALPAPLRHAVLLRHADDGPHPYSEVAEWQGTSIPESRQLVRKGLQQLRQQLWDKPTD